MVVDKLEIIEPGRFQVVLGIDEVLGAQQPFLVAVLGDLEGVLGLLHFDLFDFKLLFVGFQVGQDGVDLHSHVLFQGPALELDGPQAGLALGHLGSGPEAVEQGNVQAQGGHKVAREPVNVGQVAVAIIVGEGQGQAGLVDGLGHLDPQLGHPGLVVELLEFDALGQGGLDQL